MDTNAFDALVDTDFIKSEVRDAIRRALQERDTLREDLRSCAEALAVFHSCLQEDGCMLAPMRDWFEVSGDVMARPGVRAVLAT